MKNLETLIVFLLSAGVGLTTVRISTQLIFNKKKAGRGLYALAVFFALLIASAIHIATPTEVSVTRGAGFSEQNVILGEDDGFPYQRALVVVPSAMPLPASVGVLVAVAPPQTLLKTRRDGETLVVSAISISSNESVPLTCLTGTAHGRTIKAELADAVAPCPTR